MKIFNGTPHVITVFAEADTYPIQGGRKLVLKSGSQPIFVLPAGDKMLNAEKSNRPAPPQGDCPIPLKGGVIFTGRDPLPEGYDLYVVSNLYRSATVELGYDPRQLATVDGTVYDSEDALRPCGCLGLAVG